MKRRLPVFVSLEHLIQPMMNCVLLQELTPSKKEKKQKSVKMVSQTSQTSNNDDADTTCAAKQKVQRSHSNANWRKFCGN